jgi:hypothetical protein
MAVDHGAAGSRRGAQSDRTRYFLQRVRGEQLSRNISIAWTGIALLALIVLLEWIFRTLILKRSLPNTTTA